MSYWALFKLIISDQALITLNEFLPIYVQFNGQKFRGLSEKSFNPQFWVKMQKYAFLKKNNFNEVLYQI